MQIDIKFCFLLDVLTELADLSKTGVKNLGSQAKCGWRVFKVARVWLVGKRPVIVFVPKIEKLATDFKPGMSNQRPTLGFDAAHCLFQFFDIFSNLYCSVSQTEFRQPA